MPNKNYISGRNFEYRCIKKLESLGYFVLRQGASKFPDTIAVGRNHVFFAECKNHKRIPKDPMKLLSKEEYSRALEIMKKTDKPFFLFYNQNHKIKIQMVGGVDVTFGLNLEERINANSRKDFSQ